MKSRATIKTIKILVLVLFLTTISSYAYTNTSRFNVIKDVWISAYKGEENFNMGATSKLKLKGIQEMVIFDFDLSLLKGKNIESARLYLCDANQNNKLRKIGISTVASPWTEGKSKRNSIDKVGEGATFLYSSYKKKRWAGEGSDLTDVTMGNGYTWQHHTELKGEEGMWWSVDIAPALINALIANKSYGLLIMDESGQSFANNYVFSRESIKFSPYLLITFSEFKKEIPKKLKVEVYPSYKNAHMQFGAVKIKIFVKENLLAYDVYINGEEVPSWKIPRPCQSGSIQEIALDWLSPDEKINIQILAIDELGQRSEPVLVSGYSSTSLPRICFSAYEAADHVEKGKQNSSIPKSTHIWAVPDIVKIDPVSGSVLSEVSSEGFNNQNSIWSAEKKEISLTGVKGEVIGIQLVVEIDDLPLDELQFNVSPLTENKGDMILAEQFKFYQVHYVKKKQHWYPELVIPMQDMKIKTSDIHIKEQRNQLIYVDLSIPSEIDAGIYSGKLSILKRGKEAESIQIKLNVVDLVIPGKLSFIPELNMYRGPGKAGTDRFFQAHRLAHDHRCVINRVPYSQNGKAKKDMIPVIAYTENGDIKINWLDYDRRLEPLFNGTAFMAGERKGIPVEKFYLPFFENWPTVLALNYQYEHVQKKTREVITKHALEAPPLDEAFTSEYKERLVKTLKAFVSHFEDKGWNQTEFQFYLNNKWKGGNASSWWNLDEPKSYDDWMALRFFGTIFQEAKGVTPINLVFRADISRPRWQHDWLNGILERMYVGKSFFKYSKRVRNMKKEGRIDFSVYGSLNDIEHSNNQTVMWCMMAFVEGADGVLPWQCLGGPKAFSVPDRNALIVDARETLGFDWIVSLRVKALRRGQQDVELLAMLERRNGYNREQIRDFFYSYFGLDGNMQGRNGDGNAASKIFSNISTDKIDCFRRTLINILLAK